MYNSPAVLTVATGVTLYALYKLSLLGRRAADLPPGPPTVPFLGNIPVMPTTTIQYKFSEWARQYGDIFSLIIGPSTTVIVLSSATAVRDLLDLRSGSTADRPINYMLDSITGGSQFALARYSDTWRAMRKVGHSLLLPHASARYVPIQEAEATQLVYDLLHTPEDFYRHIRRFSNSTILSILYGKRSPRYETRESAAFFHVEHLFELVLEPGAHPPVDVFPILKYVPERWAPWKKLCAEVKRLQRGLNDGLMIECEERLKENPSDVLGFMDDVIQHKDEYGLERDVVSYLGGSLLEGGSDTTTMFLQSLVLALVAFPEPLKLAHEEMDRIVGTERMPTLDDVKDLPYIEAIVKETHRFRPVTPLAIPHANVEVEEYRGYAIPKGSTIFMNIWGIYHDPEVFDDPEVFYPSRYLRTEFGTKPGVDTAGFRHSLPFGAGRRICPGRYLAENSINLAVMNLIWGFDIKPAIDPQTGKPIPVDIWDYEKGLLVHPRPFACSFKPRSPSHTALIKEAYSEAIKIFKPFEIRLSEEDKEWLWQNRRE